MTVYVDYQFYTEQYMGTAVAQADFARLARQASALIDQVTFGRAAPVVTAGTDTATIEKIKLAACAVAEEYQSQAQGGEIQSERVGNYAVTYAGTQTASKTAKLVDAASLYLWDTDLMLRGFLEDEYGSNGLS